MVLLALEAAERVGALGQRRRAGARAVLAHAAHAAAQVRAAVAAVRAALRRRRLQQLHQLLTCCWESQR